jgi:hypothetical protein
MWLSTMMMLISGRRSHTALSLTLGDYSELSPSRVGQYREITPDFDG